LLLCLCFDLFCNELRSLHLSAPQRIFLPRAAAYSTFTLLAAALSLNVAVCHRSLLTSEYWVQKYSRNICDLRSQHAVRQRLSADRPVSPSPGSSPPREPKKKKMQ